MKNRYHLVAATLYVSSLFAQPQTANKSATAPADGESVRAELEAMFETDQRDRREVIELEKRHGRESAEVKAAWSRQSAIDRQNIRRLEEIVSVHGWPGSTVFGARAATAAFLILQHSDITYQKKYLPLAKAAAAKGEMRPSSLALLEDRILLREGKKQIYGSQVTRNAKDEWEPRPVEDEENIDALRASVGLGPISDYLRGFAERSGGIVSPRWSEKKRPNKSPEPTPTAVTPRADEGKAK